MPVYPGDPSVHLRAALTLGHDGVDVAEIRMGSHTGTHVDAPSHTVAGGRTMADVRLDELLGEALVAARARPGGRGDLRLGAARGGGRPLPHSLPPIVIIDTGWARWFGDERRLRHPALAPGAARELVRRGMRVLAVDTLSPDPTGGDAFPGPRRSARGGSTHRGEPPRAGGAAQSRRRRLLPPEARRRRSSGQGRRIPSDGRG